MQTLNAQSALLLNLHALEHEGKLVDSRNGRTQELLHRCYTLICPTDRWSLVPHRNANPLAMFAETLWVLGGRNDIEWLSYYLPRAKDFSDDGLTWRAGYGPRLRNWGYDPINALPGIDQVQAVIQELHKDVSSRRAVISLWDVREDWPDSSKDIPCNDMLTFLVRDSKLHMTVTIRSNDIIWGTNINLYEWSVLQELIANSLGIDVGQTTYLTQSLHLYERHFAKAASILTAEERRPNGLIDMYDYVSTHHVTTSYETFQREAQKAFEIEAQMRESFLDTSALAGITDEWMHNGLLLLWLEQGLRQNVSHTSLQQAVMLMSPGDTRIVAQEYVQRKTGAYGTHCWSDVKEERHFWDAYNASTSTTPNTPRARTNRKLADFPNPFDQLTAFVSLRDVTATLSRLHTRKNADYGDSWQRHGEQLSIMANLARKADRLERWANLDGKPVTKGSDETLIDTVADLLVYAIKYGNWLSREPNYDEVKAFDESLLLLDAAPPRQDGAKSVMSAYKELENVVLLGNASRQDKATLVAILARQALGYLCYLAETDRDSYAKWSADWR